MPTEPAPSSTSPATPTTLAGGSPSSTTPSSTEPTPSPDGRGGPTLASTAPSEPATFEGPPEGSYEFNVPDGYEIPDVTRREIDTLFRRNRVSNKGAQEFVDFYEKQTKEAMEAPYELWADTQQQWVDEIKADREIGGPNLNRTLSVISRFIGAMPNATEFKEALNYTGAGNNPAIIRGLYFLGKQMSEGTPVGGRQSVNTGKPGGPGARAMYPTLKSVHDGG